MRAKLGKNDRNVEAALFPGHVVQFEEKFPNSLKREDPLWIRRVLVDPAENHPAQVRSKMAQHLTNVALIMK